MQVYQVVKSSSGRTDESLHFPGKLAEQHAKASLAKRRLILVCALHTDEKLHSWNHFA